MELELEIRKIEAFLGRVLVHPPHSLMGICFKTFFCYNYNDVVIYFGRYHRLNIVGCRTFCSLFHSLHNRESNQSNTSSGQRLSNGLFIVSLFDSQVVKKKLSVAR